MASHIAVTVSTTLSKCTLVAEYRLQEKQSRGAILGGRLQTSATLACPGRISWRVASAAPWRTTAGRNPAEKQSACGGSRRRTRAKTGHRSYAVRGLSLPPTTIGSHIDHSTV